MRSPIPCSSGSPTLDLVKIGKYIDFFFYIYRVGRIGGGKINYIILKIARVRLFFHFKVFQMILVDAMTRKNALMNDFQNSRTKLYWHMASLSHPLGSEISLLQFPYLLPHMLL